MRLKVSLHRQVAPDVDIVVTADSTATIGEVAEAIIARDPYPSESAISSPTLAVVGSAAQPREQTMSEARVASGSTITVVEENATPAAERPTAARLRVVAGPDTGTEFPLPQGTIATIGRDASCDIVLSDPLVSKRHARVEADRSVEIVDLNSANGVVVDDVQVPRVTLSTGQSVQLGDTVLRIDVMDRAGARPGEDGPVSFVRSPRVEARYRGEEFEGPEIPKEHDPIPFPWVALIAPALMGIAFIFLPNVGPLRFIFIALAPVIMIGTFVNQLLTRRRKHRAAVEKFEQQLDFLQQTLTDEVERERTVRLAEIPATSEVLRESATRDSLLWTRRPEHWQFLALRLGVGDAPSRNTVAGVTSRNGIPEFIKRFVAVAEHHRLISGVPVVESFREAGSIGVSGAVGPASDAARALLVQVCGLHSPAEVVVGALVGPGYVAEFDWMKWLPHASSPDSPLPALMLADSPVSGAEALRALEDLIEIRRGDDSPDVLGALADDEPMMLMGGKVGSDQLGEPDATAPLPAVVVLVSHDAPVDIARLIHLAERGRGASVHFVWLAEHAAELPAVCRSFIDVVAGSADSIGLVRVGETFAGESDRVTRAEAAAFARGLAGVTDAGSYRADESDLPNSVSLLSLFGPELAEDGEAVLERWRQNDSILDRGPGAVIRPRRGGRLRAVVGQSTLDSLHLDLRAQGPHALVGGTTGSGKSEFLQSWVLGMAAEYSPDRVTFLLVDYKGGAAFADCVDLPHCVGLVTDLSPHLVRRALTSLRAELHYRERLLARKRAKDLIDLEKRGDQECPPALVLVIDEFAALVHDVPAFVDGVVDIAQRGRSLGIHLIMATQRPAGVIRDNLRANTNLRVALRVADAQDSLDVVGVPVAAGFDPAVPGRAVVQTGPGRVQDFQAGYAGGWTRSGRTEPEIRVAALAFGSPQEWNSTEERVDEPAGDLGPTDITRLVLTMKAAARAAKLPAPRKPWLDELAQTYDLARLHQRTDLQLVLGVLDDPAQQAQRVVHFEPDADGNIAVYGTGGSGKSTALRTLGIAAGITPRGGPFHVYGLDFSSGGLRMLEQLPHVGSIVAGDDAERVIRLMRFLRQLIDDRTVRYSAVDAGTIGEFRQRANAPDEPRVLLLVDGMATFRQEYEYTGAAGVFPMFQQILADGRQVGIHVAVSADRPGSISPAISGSIQRRVVLRLAEDNDYITLDVPSDVLTAKSPAGRAVIDGQELQIAVFSGSQSIADQSAALVALAEAMAGQGAAPAAEIGRLPLEVRLDELGPAAAGRAVIGMADDTLSPVAVDAEGVFLIAGPPASGRSRALATLVHSLRAATPDSACYYIGSPRSDLPGLGGWKTAAVTLDQVSALAGSLSTLLGKAPAKAPVIVVIEAISDFVGTPVDAELVALVKAARRNGHIVVAEAETSALMPSWPLLAEVKNARRGIALQPEAQDGETLFRTAFPRARRAEFPPGRGFLVEAGRTRRIQVAMAT